MEPIITNDAIVFAIYLLIIGAVHFTSHSSHPGWKKFYQFVPAILLCYFIPALLFWPLGLISGEGGNLYFIATRYLLPVSLIFFCMSVDLKGIFKLGPKALIMFFTSTFGVMLAAPLAVLITYALFPTLVSVPKDELWQGLGTIAASWIGGGANQNAVREILEVDQNVFGAMVVIDIVVGNLWLAMLLYLVRVDAKLNRWFRADDTAIIILEKKVAAFRLSLTPIPKVKGILLLLLVAIYGVGLAHLGSSLLVPIFSDMKTQLRAWRLDALYNAFFWIVMIATTIGILLSFTPVRKLEAAGASKWAGLFLLIMVATIGAQMNLGAVVEHLGLFVIGFIWIILQGVLLVIVGKLIKAPFFFLAIGSQANIGGAASAPVLAAEFNPALAPVGVLLAVLGLTIGTYLGLVTAYLIQFALGV